MVLTSSRPSRINPAGNRDLSPATRVYEGRHRLGPTPDSDQGQR